MLLNLCHDLVAEPMGWVRELYGRTIVVYDA